MQPNGIILTIKTYNTGLATTDALLNNNVDIAGAAEYPIVARAFEKENISIISSVSKAYIVQLVGLTDRGIRNVSDLKGKRIGLPRGTLQEFYLGRFLDLHGMSIRDVTLINTIPGQVADAIANGSVDAVVTWEPFVSRIQEQYKKWNRQLVGAKQPGRLQCFGLQERLDKTTSGPGRKIFEFAFRRRKDT